MASPYLVKARVVSTDPGLSISRMTGLGSGNGNVGLALSGGGSRSGTASMGVCRVLHRLGHLSKVRAISSVSGGSWFAVPFSYLPEGYSVDAFLGEFVEDPGALRLRKGSSPADLRTLDEGNFGAPLTKWAMDLGNIVGDAFLDRLAGVPPERLWTRQIGEDILAHFELASFTEDHLPAEFFTADPAMARAILAQNPDLPRGHHTIARDDALRRPFLVVNGSMRVDGYSGRPTLAPVQFTPLYSGVMGSGIGTLAGREVGGGGISSHAFGGEWLLGEGEEIEVSQRGPLGLSDITGISSAAYADMLADRKINILSPRMTYFAPSWKRPAGTAASFEDGGSLENTGVASLLSYTDIDKVIAVVNAPLPAEVRADGAVVIDRQVAALFGLQNFETGRGYRPFAGNPDGPGNPDYADNQVFANERGEFHALLRAFSQAHGDGAPMVVHQRLEVVDNRRFAVRGGRTVEVLWIYLSPTPQWEAQLEPEVRMRLAPNFPNITTARTGLPAVEVALMAHHSAWVTYRQRATLDAMFEG